MFSPVTLPNLRPPSVAQREADGRLVVLVERRPGVAQVAAGHRRDLAHQVVDGAAAAPAPVAPGTISMPGGTWPLTSSASRVGVGPCSTIFSSSKPVDRMISFARIDVGDAGQLDQDLVAVVALLRDARLGDAQLVDAPLDRLARLDDRFVAQVHLDVRLHRERVGAADARTAVEVRLHVVRGRPERRVLRLGNALHVEVCRIVGQQIGDGDVGLLQRLAQLLHRLLGLDLQRIVGLDAQHEMHAALEVEPELELLVHQPARANGCRSAPPRWDRRRRRGNTTRTPIMATSFQRRLRHGCPALLIWPVRRPDPAPDSRRWTPWPLRSAPCRRSAAARSCRPAA